MCAFKVLFQCERITALKTADVLFFSTLKRFIFFASNYCYSSFLFISMMWYFSSPHPRRSDIPSAVTSPRFSPSAWWVKEPSSASRSRVTHPAWCYSRWKSKTPPLVGISRVSGGQRGGGEKKRRANKERKRTFNSWTRWLFRLWGTTSKLQTHTTPDESRNVAELFGGILELRWDFANRDLADPSWKLPSGSFFWSTDPTWSLKYNVFFLVPAVQCAD